MENAENNLERWVEHRLAALEPPPDWRPDAERAFARLHQVDRVMKKRRRQRFLAIAAGAAACLAVMLLEAPQAYCAATGCASEASVRVVARARPAQPPLPQPAPQPAAAKPAPPAASPAQVETAGINFKEVGSPGAPITCEIYRDFECPPCAALFRDVIPRLVAAYVQTGKVRLVYRDLPLSGHHPYARLAARYANAAGKLGEYDRVVDQIFRTQAVWSASGDIDAQVAEVLTPGLMRKVREMMNTDSTLDESVAADMAMASRDGIRQTPSIVVVRNGRREVVSPVPDFSLLESYLDRLLAQPQ